MTGQIQGIPPRLEGAVLDKAGEGWTTRRISAWLLSDHGVTVTHHPVAKLLREHRSERADTAKTIVREKLGKTLTADLDRLEKHAAKLDRMADALEGEPELYCKAVEQLRKITDTKLHYAGADVPDESVSEIAGAEQRILGRIAGLAARSGASEADPVASTDPG